MGILGGPACDRHQEDSGPVASPVGKQTASTEPNAQSAFAAAGERLFDVPAARELEYWRTKASASELLAFSLNPRATDADRDEVARMKAGQFRPSSLFEWQPIGVPPPWDENPLGNDTWDFYRHALRWVDPLVTVWVTDADEESLALVREIVRDWRTHNRERPGASRFAWSDHSVVYRLRVFCWLLELGRQQESFDDTFMIELMELTHSHAELLASGELYKPRSNHGLEQNSALLGAAILFPEFRGAARRREAAYERVQAYVADNFSPEGFHLEQSPWYHWYVLSRLAPLARYLRINEQPPLPGLDETARQAASVWPYLIKPNGHIANIGDTPDQPGNDVQERWQQWQGAAAPAPARSTLPNPRPAPGEFLLSFDAGYAIFTAYPIGTSVPEPDTYVLYKCNAFPYAHHQNDALSFILYGLGRDWLIDAGGYSYDRDAPQRKYVRSAPAHNLVLIDEEDSKLKQVELVDFGRTEHEDFVCARHQLAKATHVRTLAFVPPRTVTIRDELSPADGQAHTYSQLFHVAPALQPKIVSDRRATLTADDGATCVIEQVGASGEWSIVTGQTDPCWQGWFSPSFLKIEPAPTLYYTRRDQKEDCVFITEIHLLEVEPQSSGAGGERERTGAATTATEADVD